MLFQHNHLPIARHYVRSMSGLTAKIILIFSLVATGVVESSSPKIGPNRPCKKNMVAGISIKIKNLDLGNISIPREERIKGIFTSEGYKQEVSAMTWEANGQYHIAISGAYERPGVYDVEIKVDGYETWKRSNIEVSFDGCHVERVRLDAELKKI